MLQLYFTHDAIQSEDKKAYMVDESMMKHNVELDEEEPPARAEDFERESLDEEEIAELLANKKKTSPTRRKQIPSKEREEWEETGGQEATTNSQKNQNSFQKIYDELKIIRSNYVNRWQIIRNACVKVRAADSDVLMVNLDILPKRKVVEDLEAEVGGLQEKVSRLDQQAQQESGADKKIQEVCQGTGKGPQQSKVV